jgi:TetR/AcrR family transcriptional regulator, transcriptional repressor for nem operon
MDTRQTLLEHASVLIRTRGYSGFSYADLAGQVGIRKASIHHHFPSKEDLGLALVDQYIEQFGQALAEISRRKLPPFNALEAYANIYRTSLDQGWACLCGMLASEVEVVPASVALDVRRFMAQSQQWLTELISAGVGEGKLALGDAPTARAATFLSICQGALLVSRAMQLPVCFEQAIAGGLRAFKVT